MTRPYSNDLHERVVRAHLDGEPFRSVAARFGVSVPSVPKWVVSGSAARQASSQPPGNAVPPAPVLTDIGGQPVTSQRPHLPTRRCNCRPAAAHHFASALP